jgi:hypothetical protein
MVLTCTAAPASLTTLVKPETRRAASPQIIGSGRSHGRRASRRDPLPADQLVDILVVATDPENDHRCDRREARRQRTRAPAEARACRSKVRWT